MTKFIWKIAGGIISLIFISSMLGNTVYAGCDSNGIFVFEFPEMLYKDSDGDGPKDASEILNGSDPCLDNDIYRDIEKISSAWGTGDLIVVDIPWNLKNIDIENSGFMVFATGGYLTQFDHWVPTETGYWLNDSQDNSRIKGRLTKGNNNTDIDGSSSGVLTTFGSQVGPNRLSVNVITDSYYPFLFLKIVDFVYGDPAKAYTEYIYMGKLHVDRTPPICSVILKGGFHEQKDNDWVENRGYSSGGFVTTMSLTGTSPDISSYVGTGFALSPYISNGTDYYNPLLALDNMTRIGVNFSDLVDPINFTAFTKYDGDFIMTNTGYTPWSKSGVYFVDTYKDNLSGLHYSKQSILDGFDLASYSDSFRGNELASISGSVTGNLSRYYDMDQSYQLYNNKVIHIRIKDRAGNENTCFSKISKYDIDDPSVVFDAFTDYVGSNFGEMGVGHLELNRGANISLTLRDDKTKCGPSGNDCIDATEGISSFRPSDLDVANAKIYYCGVGLPGTCMGDENYIYSSTGTYSAGVFLAGTGDLPVPGGVFMEEDAYFMRARVKQKPGGWYLESGTGSQFEEVLVSKRGAFISTETGFIEIQSGTLTPGVNLRSTGFTLTQYENGYEYSSGAVMTGNIAFKLYAKSLADGGVQPDDFFFVNFKFKDRAGNGITQYFEVKRRLLAKILGNVQVKSTEFIDDPVVQEFTKDKETVDENIARVKQNVRSDIVSKSDSAGEPMYISSSDLSLLDNKYKIDLGDEILYIVRNGDIVFGSGALNFSGSNLGKNITFIAYGGNVFINSTQISSDRDIAILALIDPSLADDVGGGKITESQGNILINPYLLAIKSHLIAEGSLFSYAYTQGATEAKIEIIFGFESRKSIFRNQLFIDGLIMSKNTIGGYRHTPRICPQDIYGVDNTCYVNDDGSEGNTNTISALSLMYDLHYLRMFVGEDSPQVVIDSVADIPISEIHSAVRTKNEFNKILLTSAENSFKLIDSTTTISGQVVLNTDFVNNLSNSADLRETISKLDNLKVYPIVIKNVVPNRSMKIFGNVSN